MKKLNCTSWHELDVRCHVNLNLKNSILKSYYIFDWNGEDGFLEVFRINTYNMYSAIILRVCSAKLLKGILKNERAVTRECSVKMPETCNFIKKETLTQFFSCEFCGISKNTFFQITPLVAASENDQNILRENTATCSVKLRRYVLQKY